MSSRRTTDARAIWNYAPASPHIPYAPLGNGKFIVDTLTLKIDIIAQKLTLQFPYADWLAKPNNAWVFHLREQHTGLKRCAESLQYAVAYFELPLGTGGLNFAIRGLSAGTEVWVRTLDQMCAALGLPKGEVLGMVDVVLDVWKETLVQCAAKPNSESRDSVIESD
jgi:hypothetical protein